MKYYIYKQMNLKNWVPISTFEFFTGNGSVIEIFFSFIQQVENCIVNDLPTPCFTTYEYNGHILHEFEIDSFLKLNHVKDSLKFGEYMISNYDIPLNELKK